jgi:dTDP-4-dehydrorhamnose reductase
VVLDVTSATAIDHAMGRARPDAVVYASYRTNDREITTDGARLAARAAARAGARFLFVSTDLVFGGEDGTYAESAQAVPLIPYGMHKLEAEGQVRWEHEEAVVVRPALMTGDSFHHQRPAYERGLLALGQPCAVYTDEWRCPVHVDDVVRAIWALLTMDVRGTFHLGGPERMTRAELARRICAAYGYDSTLLREARRPAERPRDVSLDSSRLTNLLGWQPRPIDAALPQLSTIDDRRLS